MKKYFFNYVFLIIFIIGSVYSPMVHAEEVVTTIVNTVVSAVEFAVLNLNIVGLAVQGGCSLAGGCGIIDNLQRDQQCRWLKSGDFVSPDCPGGSGFAGGAAIGVADSAACAGSASLTFYNDVGPHSPSEATSTLEIYRFTLPNDATYWPWGNYSTSLEGQKNAAVINWVSGADQKVGDGLFNNYNFKGDSYFLSALNSTPDTPYATVKYADVCDANGVCKIFDQSIPKDLYAAYIAKTNATYDMPIVYDDKVIFNASADCPAGTTINSTGGCVGQEWRSGGWSGYANISVPNVASIHYNDGRIFVTTAIYQSEYQSYPIGKYHVTDAAGNKTFLAETAGYNSPITSLKFEIKEKNKPYNFDVEYPIEAVCGVNFTVDSQGKCTGYGTYGWGWWGNIVVEPSYRMHYNGGYVSVTPETGKYYITDTGGNKIFAGGSTYSSGITCPAGFTWGGSYCYNYSANPYRADPAYYIPFSIKLNDSKMTSGLNVIHDFKYTCNGSDMLQNGRCQGYGNWGGWYGWGSYSPSISIKYGGMSIPVIAETTSNGYQSWPTGNYYVMDSRGVKLIGDSKGIVIPDGVPAAPKLAIDYPLLVDSSYNNQVGYVYSNFRLGNYNGGTYYPTILPLDRTTAANTFWLAGTKYKYDSSMKTFKFVLDRYTAPPAGETLVRRGKFLSTVSGQKVADTTNGLPTAGLNTGNGILGPFRPITDALCFPPPAAPTITQQACTSITLQSNDNKILGVARRIKGSNAAFTKVTDFDFTTSSIFKDAGLTPHTDYEYVLQDIGQLKAPQIPQSAPTSAYTACLPSCSISNSTSVIAKYGSLDLEWKCAADTVPISCQMQSTDSGLGNRTGLNSTGSIKISPEIDSQYTLSCANLDGAVAQPPVNITVFVPSIKEVKPQ